MFVHFLFDLLDQPTNRVSAGITAGADVYCPGEQVARVEDIDLCPFTKPNHEEDGGQPTRAQHGAGKRLGAAAVWRSVIPCDSRPASLPQLYGRMLHGAS